MGGLTVKNAEGQSVVYTYTNTLEAFEQNYAKGYRVFEVDLILTRDGYLVARHDWSPELFRSLGQAVPARVPTLAEFKKTKVLGKYTPLDITQIAQLMRTHPDMYIVTDTKHSDSWYVRTQFRAILAAFGSDSAALSRRVVVQIYDEPMLARVREVFPADTIIYTLYRLSLRAAVSDRAVQFARTRGIQVITCDMRRWTPRFSAQIRAAGIAPAVNTINAPASAAALNRDGVRFIYSDALAPRPVWEFAARIFPPPPLAPDAIPFNPLDD
jgi:glycerophosphoryl diester phosphodiesterase